MAFEDFEAKANEFISLTLNYCKEELGQIRVPYASDHAELLHKGHGNMPAWAEAAPRNYWEAADAHERANGRLFKQLEFALPKELSPG